MPPTAVPGISDDSLTYVLALRYETDHDPSLEQTLLTLAGTAPTYGTPCPTAAGCDSWSDVPEWDSIAASDEYEATGDQSALTKAERQPSYLAVARSTYGAIRAYFLDRQASLYTVYVFDSGTRCTQVPHRFFASVNGDMIWSGVQQFADTGFKSYLARAVGTATAVDHDLSDGRGVFADLTAGERFTLNRI